MLLGSIEFDNHVSTDVLHVDHRKTEPGLHVGKHQTGVVERAGEYGPEREVKRTGSAFVSGKNEKRLRWTLLGHCIEADLCDTRACTANVARGGVFQEILSGAVQALTLGDIGGCQKDFPREIVDLC